MLQPHHLAALTTPGNSAVFTHSYSAWVSVSTVKIHCVVEGDQVLLNDLDRVGFVGIQGDDIPKVPLNVEGPTAPGKLRPVLSVHLLTSGLMVQVPLAVTGPATV